MQMAISLMRMKISQSDITRRVAALSLSPRMERFGLWHGIYLASLWNIWIKMGALQRSGPTSAQYGLLSTELRLSPMPARERPLVLLLPALPLCRIEDDANE